MIDQAAASAAKRTRRWGIAIAVGLALSACVGNSSDRIVGAPAAADLWQGMDLTQLTDIEQTVVPLDALATDAGSGADTAGGLDLVADLAVADGTCSQTGCSCTENDQCDAGQCLEGGNGKVCVKLCVSGCDAGFKCVQVASSGADLVNVCLPLHQRLCEPCNADTECSNVPGGADNRCVTYADSAGAQVGHFCGAPCGANADCPGGYTCQTSKSVGGATSAQCVRQDLQCACDARATKLQLTTTCSHVSTAGACGGKRACGASGLSACDALVAQAEMCNLVDDDCDGLTDEPSTGMCDDAQACSYDNCIGGGCQNPPKTGPCDDGDKCTQGDKCDNGACMGSAVTCDDGKPCTIDACMPATGCTVTANDGAGCSDGSACTAGDACQAGACLPGTATVCDDGNPCTTDACDAKQGCVYPTNAFACTDGDLCTLGDTCKDGACKPTGKLPCNDGNPCTDDSCDTVKGCQFDANTMPCDDHNECTTGDSCKSGTCTPDKPSNCDDGNPCTTETCDAKSGCKSVANAAPCSDGDMCTADDACAGGTCVPGKPLACADGNPCTDDACEAKKGCVFAASTAACTDNNVCTEGDACKAGACLPGAAKSCDDGTACTTDACDPQLGCSHAPNNLPCNDGNFCTEGDACKGGVCAAGQAKTCDDGNPCTADVCDSIKGCTLVSNADACSDNNVCTEGDQCGGGKCLPGKGKACSDGNPCTDDLCDPGFGCTALANTLPCDDGSACTQGDACKDKACVGGGKLACDDGNPCTDDTCDAAKGCSHTANGAACSDGNTCTEVDVCQSGLCVPGKALNCDDGNACSTDACAPGSGCAHADNTAGCSDGSVCTGGDGCKNGGCVAGTAIPCNDGNPCTNDACDAKTGCVFTAKSSACDDGNPCTTNDACANGSCAGTGCDGNAACTVIAAKSSCTCNSGYAGDGYACADINECTSGTAGCDANATCTNAPGSFICACKAGFSGDGKACADINECLTNNGGCGVQLCTNTAGGFQCTNTIHGTVAFVGASTASGCSYNNQHAVKWDNLGSLTWKNCVIEASKRGAMLHSQAYTVTPGWGSHRSGATASHVSSWPTYASLGITSSATCIVSRDPVAGSTNNVALANTTSYDGQAWHYQDYGSMYYDQCQTKASQAGAMIITPHTIGSSGDNYWVNSTHMCNTYEWITGGGTTMGNDNLGSGARSSQHSCMVGYVDN